MSFIDWLTNENNPKLEKSEYLYGTRHIILLAITAFLCVAVGLLLRKRSEKAKRAFFIVGASLLLFFEIATRVVDLWFLKDYTVMNVLETVLPMHICSVMVWIFIIGIYSKNKFLLNYSAIAGFLSTLAFLLYPAVGINQKYMAFTNVYSTFSHMLGFVICVSLMTLRRVEFRFKKIWQPYLCLVIMFSYGWFLNWILFPGSDYMYMRNDPLGLNLNFPYQYLYSAILAVYVFMFYFVNLFTRKKVKASNAVNVTNTLTEDFVMIDSEIETMIKESNEKQETTNKVVKDNKVDNLSKGEKTVLEVISNNVKANKKQIASDAKVSDYELDKYIKSLKEKGKLERVGPGNGGYWKVNLD